MEYPKWTSAARQTLFFCDFLLRYAIIMLFLNMEHPLAEDLLVSRDVREFNSMR